MVDVILRGTWLSPSSLGSRKFQCGYCHSVVASTLGSICMSPGGYDGEIRYCSHCNFPTFFTLTDQYPGPMLGETILNVPDPVNVLYNEARLSASARAYTAAVLALRKLLMNIAVDKKAPVGLSFEKYVEYLDSKGYVPPDGKSWVDLIRSKGNEATHQIVIMKQPDAEVLINFASMLLKFIYEFPNRALHYLPKKSA